MKFELLSRLAMACCDGTRPYRKGENLNELFIQTEQAEAASGDFAAALAAALDAADLADPQRRRQAVKAAVGDMDDANGRAICDYEEQGFINGFRFAVKLFMECSGGPAAGKGAQQ